MLQYVKHIKIKIQATLYQFYNFQPATNKWYNIYTSGNRTYHGYRMFPELCLRKHYVPHELCTPILMA
jgi:hypothetical protein